MDIRNTTGNIVAWLKRKFGPPAVISMPADGEDIMVVGSEYCGGVPRSLGTGKPVQVMLVREPRNEHDRNAVAVMSGQRRVGYVSASRAEALAPYMDHYRATLWVHGVVKRTSQGRELWVVLPRDILHPHRR